TAGSDRLVRQWDTGTGNLLKTLQGPAKAIEVLVRSPNGRFVFAGGGDWQQPEQPGELTVWDLSTGKKRQSLSIVGGCVFGMAISPDGRTLATGQLGRVRLWRVPAPPPIKPALLFAIPWQDEQQGVPANIFHTGISADGRLFFGAGDAGPSGRVRVFELATGKMVNEFLPEGGDPWYSFAQFLPDAKHLVTSYTKDTSLYLWDITTGKLVRKFVGHTEPNVLFAVAPDGKRLVSWSTGGTDEKILRLWDVETGRELRQLNGHTEKAAGVFSPDGRRILTFSADTTLRLWDVESGRELKKLEGHTDACTGCFSPDGTQALSYSPDQTIRLWDLATGREIRRFKGPTDRVWFAGFVAGGRLVVGRSDDRKLRLWKVGDGELISEININKYGGGDKDFAVTPDGRQALVRGEDDSVRVLDLPSGRQTHRYDHCPAAYAFSLSPDGTSAVAGSCRQGLYVFRLPAPPAK
ncbi:MAG TPA: WD40 repeat domain-containing protein, partial [Gemmataceae bacterium]|nr:WD40 repeat domain-containing protein [Gemmataceae bacterium]